MTGKQQTVGWLVLFLVIADMIDGGLRDAMSTVWTKADSGGSNLPGLPGLPNLGGPIGPFNHYRLNPLMPDIPHVPQGPWTGIPFSPVSTNPHGLPPKTNHPAQPAPILSA